MQMHHWARMGSAGALLMGALVIWGALSLSLSDWQQTVQAQFSQLLISEVSPWQWQWSQALSRLPAALFVVSIYPLVVFFRRIEHGMLFDPDTIRALKHFSRWLLLSAIAGISTSPLLSLLLSWHQPGGQRFLSIDIGTPALNSLGVALLVWLIAQILHQGLLLARENQEFI